MDHAVAIVELWNRLAWLACGTSWCRILGTSVPNSEAKLLRQRLWAWRVLCNYVLDLEKGKRVEKKHRNPEFSNFSILAALCHMPLAPCKVIPPRHTCRVQLLQLPLSFQWVVENPLLATFVPGCPNKSVQSSWPSDIGRVAAWCGPLKLSSRVPVPIT